MKKAAVYVAVTVAALVVAETLARVFLWSPPVETDVGTPRQGLTRDAVGDWVPDQHGVWIDRLEFPYFVHINGAGFRNLDEIDPNAVRVLALGDSYTFGLFVSNYDIWTRVAERLLTVRLHRPVQILNNGLSGGTIVDYLAYLREKGARLSPRLVLLVIYNNDVSDLKKAQTTIGFIRDFGIGSTGSVPLRGLRWFLRHHSALYVAARKAKEHFLVWQHAIERRAAQLPETRPASLQADGRMGILPVRDGVEDFAGYRRLLAEAVGEIRKLGATPVLVFLPAPDVPAERLFEVVRKTAKSHSVDLIDLRPAYKGIDTQFLVFRRDASVDPDYRGDSHLTRFGNIRVGQAFAERFEPVLRRFLASDRM